jgi:hypothetical protein
MNEQPKANKNAYIDLTSMTNEEVGYKLANHVLTAQVAYLKAANHELVEISKRIVERILPPDLKAWATRLLEAAIKRTL